MKKTFLTSILAAVFITVGTAAEPKPDDSASLEKAKTRYVDTRIDEFDVGWNVVRGRRIPLAKIEKLRVALRAFVDEQLVPFLLRNDILDDWIEMQFDREVERLHLESLQARNVGDILKIAQEGDALVRKRWPKFLSKTSTPEWDQLQHALQDSMRRILDE